MSQSWTLFGDKEPKHGTPERWATCACKECDDAQMKAGHARKMTDRDRIDAYLATIPGDDAKAWQAIVDAGDTVLPRRVRTWQLGEFRDHGDGTVDAKTWGHLRNIVDALRQLAFVLGAAERGDDPDIPF